MEHISAKFYLTIYFNQMRKSKPTAWKNVHLFFFFFLSCGCVCCVCSSLKYINQFNTVSSISDSLANICDGRLSKVGFTLCVLFVCHRTLVICNILGIFRHHWSTTGGVRVGKPHLCYLIIKFKPKVKRISFWSNETR